MRRFILIALILLGFPTTRAFCEPPNLNRIVLEQISKMPRGGNYAATRIATLRLQSAAHFEQGKFFVVPEGAAPSYCSGATYLVFLKTIEELRRRSAVTIENAALMELIVRDQKDGEGIWGRWNANGPGTARLFHELDLGSNFTDYSAAQPGDFMKIFWNREIGKNERGHSVIFLGLEQKGGAPHARFWSSNKPAGYGEKSVPISSIANVIFSRLQRPANLNRATSLARTDAYLASMLTTSSTLAEAKSKCGIAAPPAH
jgi:hypothetical protein